MNVYQLLVLLILLVITGVFIYFAINFESPDAMLTLSSIDNQTNDDDFM